MQLCDHGIEVVEDPIRELLFSQFIPYMILRIELRYVPGQGRQPDIFRYGLGPLKRGGNRNRGTTNDGRQESRTVCHRTSAGSPSGYLSELPLTPIAPIRTPAWSTIGRPPGKVIRLGRSADGDMQRHHHHHHPFIPDADSLFSWGDHRRSATGVRERRDK